MSKLLGYIRISGDLHLFGKEMVRDCLGYQANVIGDDVCGMGGDCDIAVEEDTLEGAWKMRKCGGIVP